MSDHHILVVTGEGDDLAYEIECPGVTDACRAWYECQEGCNALDWDNEADRDALDALEQSDSAHGVEHAYLPCGWSVPSNRCIVREYEDIHDAISDLVISRAGRYPVDFEWAGLSGDEYLLLTVPALAEHVDRQGGASA